LPGMSSGLAPGNSTIVSAFQSALLHQAVVVVALLVLLAIAWSVLKSVQLRSALDAAGGGEGASASGTGAAFAAAVASAGYIPVARYAPAAKAPARPETSVVPEPAGRRLLRISFGLLWVFDGILQGQSSMPLGMTTRVIEPTASASPHWVQHVANFGATIWSDHPIAASSASVWIQLGIGLWLLVAPRGNWSRAAGLASVAWGLIVWVFGEVFGGLFAPGVSWMFGAPGAVLFYCLAGALLVLDEHRWSTGQIGRVLLRCLGVFFAAMAVVQALPGRGFWQGRLSGVPSSGTLAAMAKTMAATPQPHYFSSWLNSFGSFVSEHGFGVNLFVVIALATLALGLLSRRPAVLRWAVVASVVVCLADWVLAEDLGFFGGTGTDPNSMIPLMVLIVASYVALTRATVRGEVLSPELELPANLEPDLGWLSEPEAAVAQRTWRERVRARPVYAFRVIAALSAVALVLLGAAPMALASLNGQADPIVYRALDGTPSRLDIAAPGFVLHDSAGGVVSLASLRGKVVVLAFLDPVATEGSPVLAQELRRTASLLSSDSGRVEFVGVVSNPLYRSPEAIEAFDQVEGLNSVPNWVYLTGPARRLAGVWKAYQLVTHLGAAGSILATNYQAYVIDAAGDERFVFDDNPGPGTAAFEASFAAALATSVRQVLTTR
jgi:cytochrome oxidase Cu insertion factor (SCO1/SenC/PrrC family)